MPPNTLRVHTEYVVTKPITSPQLLRTPRPCRQSCGNSSLCINSWKGSSELGPRRHKRRILGLCLGYSLSDFDIKVVSPKVSKA
ncbi:hypothetical protein TNCV_496891 [Trichonephila clavipes]|nr:hypothetical protein TNCV_496891 [Trichonephila clavipes]